jgi:signal transduction histidine kinase
MIFRRLWSLLRSGWVPLLLVGLAALLLWEPVTAWLEGDDRYDQEAMSEWVREARIYETLPELVAQLLVLRDKQKELDRKAASTDPGDRPSQSDLDTAHRRVESQREQIDVHLKAMCDPVTKVYAGRLPLFVVIYSMTVGFDDKLGEKPLVWDSGKPSQPNQRRTLKPLKLHERGVWVDMQYQVRVFARQQLQERQSVAKWRWLSMLGLPLTVIAGVWFVVALRRKKDREMRHLKTEQQATEAERLRLEEALKRQEAEQKQREAERTALELKSQLFANIGIMAGSYAHNIKNLLVRPNDLLGRCLEQDGLSMEQGHMLREVRQTLGTVTERLQQILQTVRRDPNQSETVRLDLNDLVREMHQTWGEMARDKWKLALSLDLAGDAEGHMWIEGDRSHLQQAVENLVFNARDATFEMRNHLRDQARKSGDRGVSPAEGDGSQYRRQALIAAAAWKGQVWLRTCVDAGRAVLEIEDNGIGMSAEVLRRCTETHFSTKRDNALFAGLSAGMGLGLSFVVVILEHHGAKLEITSEPLRGARFRVTFPLAVHGEAVQQAAEVQPG